MPSHSRLVYSSEGNNQCEQCGKSLQKCRCEQTTAEKPISDGIIRLSLDTKGRKGKGVTLVTGFDVPEDELKKIAKRLKALCSSGGTTKQGVIEIQGDHRIALKSALESDYTVKFSGG